jgi:hypothetical protein
MVVVALCDNSFGLAASLYILQLASRAGEDRIIFQMLPCAIPTCHRGQEVAEPIFCHFLRTR